MYMGWVDSDFLKIDHFYKFSSNVCTPVFIMEFRKLLELCDELQYCDNFVAALKEMYC